MLYKYNNNDSLKLTIKISPSRPMAAAAARPPSGPPPASAQSCLKWYSNQQLNNYVLNHNNYFRALVSAPPPSSGARSLPDRGFATPVLSTRHSRSGSCLTRIQPHSWTARDRRAHCDPEQTKQALYPFCRARGLGFRSRRFAAFCRLLLQTATILSTTITVIY